MKRAYQLAVAFLAVFSFIAFTAANAFANATAPFNWEQLTDSDTYSIATDGSGRPLMTGNANESPALSSVDVFSNQLWKNNSIDLIATVEKFKAIKWPKDNFERFADFPISAIAFFGARAFAGTSGFLFYSENNGADWHVVDTLRTISTQGGESGSHLTCKGAQQKGVTSSGKKETIGVRRVCDIIFSGNRAIVAYDQGLVYNDKILQHILEPSNRSYLWSGAPIKNTGGNELFGLVVNDIEKDGGLLLAATSNGFWKSGDMGEKWEMTGLKGKNVLSIHVISSGNYLAGTSSDISEYKNSEWSEAGELSDVMAILTTGDTTFAGTLDGLFFKGAQGTSWSKVEGAPFNEVRTISSDGASIFVGTDKGLFSSRITSKAN